MLVLTNLFNIATFDFLDCADKLRFLFDLQSLDQYPPYNDSFNLLGYNFNNVLLNIGLPVFFVMGYLGFVGFYILIFKLPIRIL